MKILLVNCKPRQCGVYEFGLNLWKCVCGFGSVSYLECNGQEDLFRNNPQWADVIIYNHHPVVMPWLTSDVTDKIPSGLIVHDTRFPWPRIGYIHSDPTMLETGRDLKIGRPILPSLKIQPNVIAKSIGSFGFGFDVKGFHELIQRVNDEYETATVRLHIPHNTGVDWEGTHAKMTAARCFGLAKPGVTCYISHNWMSEQELLVWLAQNEINVFLYKDNASAGLASCIDWALRARRPIAVSDLQMFRHIHSVVKPNEPLKDAIARGTKPLEKFYADWTPENLYQDIQRVAGKIVELYR